MKRKFRFDMEGDEVIAEWDGFFLAYTVHLYRNGQMPALNYSGPMGYFLGRAGHYKAGSDWQNGQFGSFVQDELEAPDLESLVRTMVLVFRRDHPRPC